MTAALRLRVLPRFPARITGQDGVKVTRAGNSPDLTVSLDFANLGDIAGIPDPANNYFAMYDEATETYVRIPFQSMFDAAGVSSGYQTKAAAELAVIPAPVNAILLFGDATVGDGLGGLYIDVNNGSSDTFVSAGGTSRTWYRAEDVGPERLRDASGIRVFLDTPPYVDTRTALKALNTTKDTVAYLKEAGRQGIFQWTTGDFSAHIAADTQEGIYVKADAIASTAGAWIRVDRNVVNPLMFGALRGRANATTTTTALQKMIDYCGREGAAFDLLGGNWFTNSTLTFSEPVTGYGRGRGYWHPKPPTAADGVATVAATQIILTGTGPRVHTVHGISSMAVSGGVITNPSASLGNDGTYGLTSFENSVATASGRSRKAFSAGMWFEPSAAGSNISGFRIVPDGDGDDGINKYITAGLATDAWAADWDVGIVIEMANDMVLKDIEAVGHYRMMGELLLAVPASPSDSAIPALWGVVHENVQTSGWRATEVRGADVFRCVAVGADYIEVPWADDHPFDPSALTSIGYGTGTFSLTGTKTFSSISKQGSNLRLSGISTPADISVGNHIYARVAGGGTSHCRWDSACKFTGMHHQSGNLCHSSALGGNAMPRPGAGFVASGWRMTELEVLGALQGIEEIGVHVHALSKSDIFLDMEGSGSKPLRIISSPTEASNTRVTNPAGKTQFTMIDSRRDLVNETGIDARPILDSASASAAYPSDSGFFSMDTGRIPSMGLVKANGAASFEYDRTNGRNSHSAHNFPSADNTYDDGSASFRKRSDFARNQFFGSGTAALTGQAGTPIGSAGGAKATILVDETNAKAYIKPSATGNTDWRELAQMLVGSTTWDPASLADGAGVSQNVTVTGAVLGDFCVPSFSLNIQGMILTAHVTSADTVTVRLQNETGGTIDLGSGTLRVAVIKL